MRPYQIAATERNIVGKLKVPTKTKNGRNPTVAATFGTQQVRVKRLPVLKRHVLATQLDFIDKVFFVVDRKDLDFQTMKEYQRFSPDSVNGSDSTAGLKRNIEKDDNKINCNYNTKTKQPHED